VWTLRLDEGRASELYALASPGEFYATMTNVYTHNLHTHTHTHTHTHPVCHWLDRYYFHIA
jgi:hypothetical protein